VILSYLENHYVLKLMGLNGTIPSFRRNLFLLFFFWEQHKRAKIKNKKEKYLDKQGKNLLQ